MNRLAPANPPTDLSRHLDAYRVALRQLDLSSQALYDLGFLTESSKSKIENLLLEELARAGKALKAIGHYAEASTPAPTGLPSLDAARKVAAGSAR